MKTNETCCTCLVNLHYQFSDSSMLSLSIMVLFSFIFLIQNLSETFLCDNVSLVTQQLK